MTNEQKYFLNILKQHLNHESSALHGGIDWDEMLAIAGRHNVEGIIYMQCRKFLPDRTAFEKRYAAQIYYSKMREQMTTHLKKTLAGNDFLLLKGAVVADLYPIPLLRTMGDVDVLIHPEERAAVHEKLLKAGFILELESSSVWVYHYGASHVEVHDNLIHASLGGDQARAYFENVWKYTKNGDLDWDFHFLFMIQHLKGHLVSSGVGFRQFMDIAIVTEKVNLNWKWILEEAKKIGLERFVLTVLAMNQRWFGIVPKSKVWNEEAGEKKMKADAFTLKLPQIDDDFYERATSKIFKDGVFGHENEENQNIDVSRVMMYEGGSIHTAKRKLFFRQLFPQYYTMCRLPYCRYVRRSKLLLPAAWVHRIFYRFFNSRHRRGFIDRVFISGNDVKQRKDLLDEWGL